MEAIYVGIDVSKDTLDVVVRRGGQNGKAKTFANATKGIAELVKGLPKQPAETIFVCLEATGQYGEAVCEQLHALGYQVSLVNPLRTKRYAQAGLLRNQSDPVDAGVIAAFCQHQQPRLWVPPSPAHKLLRALSRRQADLQGLLQMETNRLKASRSLPEAIQTSLQAIITTLKAEIKSIKRTMRLTIDAEVELKRQKQLLQSIPGVGEQTATRFLAELGDLRTFANAKQLAAFLGLTPESKTSGTSVHTKPRLSKKGPAGVRHILFMPAVVSSKCNPIVQAFYQRLLAAGKTKMSAIGAVMHKLVHLMFGVVHSGKPFDPLYLSLGQVAS